MTKVCPFLSVINLNVNELNILVKRQRLAEWIKTHDPTICCLQETQFRSTDTNRLKMKKWKKILHANGN